MNSYPFLLVVHLFAAFVFVGTVTFEVLFMEPVQKRLPVEVRKALGAQLGPRVRAVVPWAVLVLYLAGLGMAWQHRAALASPGSSPFGLLLSIKIALATSVLIHVVIAMTLARRQRLRGAVRRRVHISVFCHMVGIVLLAKTMFHLSW
ncbi:MAG: CopD family copper resistance protein [Achromobacter veterisilvae]